MAEAPLIKTFRSGATGLILSLCNEIKLVEHINHAVTWDPTQWKVSPGEHILALVINTLCGRVPLYRVEKFYEEQTWRDFSVWEEKQRTSTVLYWDAHSTQFIRRIVFHLHGTDSAQSHHNRCTITICPWRYHQQNHVRSII